MNLAGIFQAICTAGKVITQTVTSGLHRPRLIDYEKLVAVKLTQWRPMWPRGIDARVSEASDR
jgi:hypothetical protein